jgi:formylglycine-generating enzyme required for sulfatase activity
VEDTRSADPPSPVPEDTPARLTRNTRGVSTGLTPGEGREYADVPGYEILGILGHGGMGVVYRARQLKANRLVALKMIRAVEHASPEERLRFQIETEAVARLQHPHIVQLYAVGEVKRRMARKVPRAMILEVRGTVRLESPNGEQKAAVPQTLVHLDDRLRLAAHADVHLVFVSDFHKQWVKPGREVTIDYTGCQPADAVLKRDNSVLMNFVHLPKGTFYMGWDGSPGSAKKRKITEDFEIAVHAVTQGQWQAVMGNNPSYFSRTGSCRDAVRTISDEELKLFPVETVAWTDARVFIKKLNEKERGRGYVYRLPTVEEWEYVCRGGAASEKDCSYHFYFDRPTNDLSSEQANFKGTHPDGKAPKGKWLNRTTRVGSYPPNKLCLCNMHGNVWQWCAEGGVDRGGGWYDEGHTCRAVFNDRHSPGWRNVARGLRLVRVPDR